MGKIYGERWEIIRDVGKGGQSDVFEARDRSAPADAETVALKRVKNPNRFPRFRNEVEAIERLSHPNVIKLIDHSALDVKAEEPEKQYIVMPMAHGGDLSKQVSIYKANLDGAVIVAKQVASALAAAHAEGIIHRDVKPQNVLFPSAGKNDIWLTDFGICFVRDEERPTESDEVVGPWAFMAPELAYGGQLDVRPSADVYSLGKLIYYMISGGKIIPREELTAPAFASVFSAGGRYHVLNMLLRRMICDVSARIGAMREVIAELDRIADWDRQSTLVPVAPATLSKLEKLQQAVMQTRAVVATNASNAEAQKTAESQVLAHLTQWLKDELTKASELISTGGTLSASVRDIPVGQIGVPHINQFRVHTGVELVLEGVSTKIARHDVFQMLICLPFGSMVTVEVHGVHQARTETIKPAEDREIGILPVYVPRTPTARAPASSVLPGYLFGAAGELVVLPQPGSTPAAGRGRALPPPSPAEGKNALFKKFRFSEWPSRESSLRDFISLACDQFIASVTRNRDSLFVK